MARNVIDYLNEVHNRSGGVLSLPEVGTASDVPTDTLIDPYSQDQYQKFPLGTKFTIGDRVWRYCLEGGVGLAAGCPLQAAAVQNAAANLGVVVDATAAIGATTVSLTSQAAIAVAKDYYKEGYLFVNEGTGFGHGFKVKTHEALVSTTAGSIFTLYDPLTVALATSSSKVGLRKNHFDSVIATAAVLTGAPVGVAIRVVTASYYFWAQTGGPCCVVTHAAIATGAGAVVGTTAAQVDPSVDNESTLQRIGFCMVAPDTAGEGALIFLTLDR